MKGKKTLMSAQVDVESKTDIETRALEITDEVTEDALLDWESEIFEATANAAQQTRRKFERIKKFKPKNGALFRYKEKATKQGPQIQSNRRNKPEGGPKWRSQKQKTRADRNSIPIDRSGKVAQGRIMHRGRSYEVN